MSQPMPIELVLAAHDFEMPCVMSIAFACPHTAVYLVQFGHTDGTAHCDPSARLPLCADHTTAAKMATAGGPLMEWLGAPPPPDCICGKTVSIHGITTVRGEPA
jgi:hypothetical protein